MNCVARPPCARRDRISGVNLLPTLREELVAIVSGGGKHGAFVLQVYGYWDMVAAFVESGALDAKLVYNTCQEMYFQYTKIQPYLAEFRKIMNLPEWMSGIERLVEESDIGRSRLQMMKQNLAALAAAKAASNPETPTT